MRQFRRKSCSLLGVDIGSTTVKLVELGGPPNAPRLEGCAVAPLPEAAAGNAANNASNGNSVSNINDANVVGEAIRAARRSAASRAKRAAVAVPCAAAIAKTISLDAALDDRAMEVEVALEAERLAPFAAEELALDFEPLHLNAADPAMVDVLLVACRVDQLAARESALREGGLKAALVDVETYCLQRAALAWQTPGDGQGDDAVAIVDAGAATVSLLVLDGERVLFAREEAFAGANLFETRGERAYAEDALRLAERLLRQFASAHPEQRLGRVWLAGGGACNGELALLAKECLAMPVAAANPFLGMEASARVDADWLRRQAPSLTTAFGLALRTFDGEDARCCA